MQIFLQKAKAFDFDCGIPTSLIKGTNQQWEYPNAWPSHNHLIIEAFRKSGFEHEKHLI